MPSYNQDITIKSLKKYIAAKQDTIDDRMDNGLCPALVALWLNACSKDKEHEFLSQLEYVNNWEDAQFKDSNAKIDIDMEEFLHVTLALTDPNHIIHNIRPVDLHLSLPLVLDPLKDVAGEPELSLSFIFNKSSIQEIIPQIVQNKKMVRISNGLHVIGLMLRDKVYRLYDPNSSAQPKDFTNTEELAREIFNDLNNQIKSPNYIAINFTIFDLKRNQKSITFNPTDYIKLSLNNPTLKNEALHNKFLFWILAKFDEYAAMDLLFAAGYTYLPWTVSANSELHDAISFHNDKKVVYLLKKGLSPNYAIRGNQTPLCEAIVVKNNKILYQLLKSGANPNLKARTDNSNLDIALQHDNPEAIVLLLACGMNLTATDFYLINEKYNESQVHDMVWHAIEMNKMFLKLPKTIDLSTCHGSLITNLAQHVKLLGQLQRPFKDIDITYKNDAILDNNIMATLIDIYNNEPISERFNVVDKDLLYQILTCIEPGCVADHPAHNIRQEIDDLLSFVTAITRQFISQPATEHGMQKLLEAQIALEKISQLQFVIDDEASTTNSDEKKLRDYLARNKIKQVTHQYNSIFSCTAKNDIAISKAENDILSSVNLKH